MIGCVEAATCSSWRRRASEAPRGRSCSPPLRLTCGVCHHHGRVRACHPPCSPLCPRGCACAPCCRGGACCCCRPGAAGCRGPCPNRASVSSWHGPVTVHSGRAEGCRLCTARRSSTSCLIWAPLWVVVMVVVGGGSVWMSVWGWWSPLNVLGWPQPTQWSVTRVLTSVTGWRFTREHDGASTTPTC